MSKGSKPIAVVGAGGWGTALAWLLAHKGQRVRLWGRTPELVKRLQTTRENYKYLPGVRLPEHILATADLPAALRDSELIIFAVPSCGVRTIAEQMRASVGFGAIVVSVAKGLDPTTGQRLSEVLAEILPPTTKIAVMSGPNLSREVVQGIPTTTVVASADPTVARRVQEIFNVPTFRVYTNPDVAGVELGGALKNVIAIGAGISDGLGFGDNTKAALVTRGLAEIRRLGVVLGARAETFSGLTGLGDLVATCASPHSRNRRVGFELGQGRSLEEIVAAMGGMVAEGIPTTATVYRLAQKYGVEMPITAEIYRVLFEGKSPRQAVADLMRRATKGEFDD
ncbi:MAG TPA: NAD(P)H-dependent glycerol-3-phosphate dehydrogenase [Armatimonadetes bacterium]|nr:NAD(P)H-dependent glycerol-3-phosphate dehydrogenase [Armatimonadota bacterium]